MYMYVNWYSWCVATLEMSLTLHRTVLSVDELDGKSYAGPSFGQNFPLLPARTRGVYFNLEVAEGRKSPTKI